MISYQDARHFQSAWHLLLIYKRHGMSNNINYYQIAKISVFINNDMGGTEYMFSDL
jgi:hypothetical protein